MGALCLCDRERIAIGREAEVLVAKLELFDIWKNARFENLIQDGQELLERFQDAGIQYKLARNLIMAEVYVPAEKAKKAYEIIRQRARKE